ncbi:unnamed protein product [Cunninghamella blakesleeana]
MLSLTNIHRVINIFINPNMCYIFKIAKEGLISCNNININIFSSDQQNNNNISLPMKRQYTASSSINEHSHKHSRISSPIRIMINNISNELHRYKKENKVSSYSLLSPSS